MLGRFFCKMDSPDLQAFVAERPQNLCARRISALCSLFVRLMHVKCVSA
jgi:hypothetical protein